MLIFHFIAQPDKQAWVQCLCYVRLSTFTAQSKMTSRYLEPGILGERCFADKEAIHEFGMLGMLYFLPEYCQTSHSLLLWYCSPPCCADCCSKHLPCGATKPRTLLHLTYLTCSLHAHELAQINSINDDGAFWRAGRTTPVSVPGEGVHWEQRDVGSVAYMRGIFGEEQLCRAGGVPQQLTFFWTECSQFRSNSRGLVLMKMRLNYSS